jgi:hypothetical protein
MRKGRVITLCGWLCILLGALGWGDALLGGFTLRRVAAFPPPVAAALVLLSAALALAWLLGTLVWSIRAAGARVIGKPPATAPGGGAPGVPRPMGLRERVPGPAQGPALCVLCKQVPAVVRCVEHDALLCQGCWEVHERAHHSIAAGGR